MARQGWAWRGKAWRGRAGKARQGTAGRGEARQGRHGEARHGKARQGMAGKENETNNKTKHRNKMNIRANTSEAAMELSRIAKANGGELTPEAVLKNAKCKTSPIHDWFTWDNTEAAEKLRLIEASALIRSVKCRVEMHDQDEPITTRAFVNVRPTEVEATRNACSPGVYVPVHTALKSEDYRAQMLANAARELSAFKNKYSILKELSSVFSAADAFQQSLKLKS